MTELRMTMAEPTETVTPKHVAAALNDCSSLNNSDTHWAALDIVPTIRGTIVHMDIGNIRSNGIKERSTQIFTYSLDSNGEVHVTKYTHA